MFTTQKISLVWLSSFILLSGCVAGEIQKGRMALLYGDPNVVVGHFQRAAELDPDYLYYSVLPQGVWTYVGRANYNARKFPGALKALERARSKYEQDDLAKLYLGLVLARNGNQARGLKEIQSGLRGIHDWLDYVDFNLNSSYGQFWDPTRKMRSEIESTLAMFSGRDVDVQKVIASGEWIGRKMEEEIDLAQKDEQLHHGRRAGGDN